MAQLPDYTDKFRFGDLFLYIWLMHTTGLKARVLDDVTAVYRLHPSGVYGSTPLVAKHTQHLEFYALLRQHVLGDEYDRAITTATAKHHWALTFLHADEHDYRRALISLAALFHSSNMRIAGSATFELIRKISAQARRKLSPWIPSSGSGL